MNKQRQRGITLIALVVTIIVLLIIAGIAIITLTSENGIINKSLKASFIEELTNVDEIVQLELHGNALKIYSGETEDIIFDSTLKVKDNEIPITLRTELERLEGTTSNLYWVPANLANGREKTYMYETKIKVVFKQQGLTIGGETIHSIKGASLGPLVETVAKMDVSTTYGYYEPDLNGFDINNTYIVYYTEDFSQTYTDMTLSEYLELGKPQTHDLIVNGETVTYYFHNYKEETNKSIWANVVTRANGLEAWWVWIPRYAYILGNKTSNVVFTTIDDDSLNEAEGKNFTGDNMGNYIPHAGFNLKDGTKLKGIWMAKYEASISSNGNDTLDNGKQKYYKPNLKGYNINSTYVVTYNESGTSVIKQYLLKDILASGYEAEENGILVSGEVDESKFDSSNEYWYNYSKKIWGNIVTNANGLEAWWVWIPRYAYILDSSSPSVDIVFITTDNKMFNGNDDLGLYKPHLGFTLKDGTELEGIWMAKYEASGTFESSDATISE